MLWSCLWRCCGFVVLVLVVVSVGCCGVLLILFFVAWLVEFVVVVFGLVGFLLFCVLGVRVVLLCVDVVGVLLQPCLGLLYTYPCS